MHAAADAGDVAEFEWVEGLGEVGQVYGDEAVGFFEFAGEFGDEAVGCEADGGGDVGADLL